MKKGFNLIATILVVILSVTGCQTDTAGENGTKVSVADLEKTLSQTNANEVRIIITDSKPNLSQIETTIKKYENIKIKLDLSQCTDLTNIKGVFGYCSNLTGITIPNSVTVIGEETLCGCSGLTTITIPDSVTTIDDEAFYYCSNLTNVTIGKGVTKIVGAAFGDCRKLKTLTVKATTPPSIGSSVFRESPITTIYVPSSSVNAYKSASGWSKYSGKIQGK